ncbi:hypothetical protein COE51_16265 [Bacillus pseudomycoides]|nr:hypothetical protein COE51_16265 [Bacillus pseudomycoides]
MNNLNSLSVKSRGLSEKLLSEWHPTKNEEIDPNEITEESYEYIWWKCSNEGHEFGMTVRDRYKKEEKCPRCMRMNKYKNQPNPEEDEKLKRTLIEVDSELAKQWHPTKNGELTPEMVLFGDEKTSRWWQCKRGHEWRASIKYRHENKDVCEYCSDKIVYEGNCLATVYPEIAKEWFVFGNMKFDEVKTPYDVLYNSSEEVKWICREGHIWEEKISKRIKDNPECPKCVQHRNSLALNNPALAKEWHPEKNKYNYDGETPEEIRINYGKQVWWLCGTCGNEYKASVSGRDRGEERCKVCHPSAVKGRMKEYKPRSKFDLRNKMEDQRILFENNLRDNLKKKED